MSVYTESKDETEQIKTSALSFKEVSRELGVDSRHELFSPGGGQRSAGLGLALSSIAPGLAVEDLNGDGFYDFIFTQPKPGLSISSYMNTKGAGFSPINIDLFKTINDKNNSVSVPVFLDINRDGYIDLFLAYAGCHKAFFGDGTGRFLAPKSDVIKFCGGPPGSVAVLDFNRDGWSDIVVTTFAKGLNGDSLTDPIYGRGDKSGGGKNTLFINRNGKLEASEIDFLYRSHTRVVGTSDINNDGWVDIYFGNDLAIDELFININGDSVKEVTESALPIHEHGYSSMNAEFSDFNQDGKLDLFVSSLYKPPFINSTNLLWINQGNGRFVNEAKRYGVDKCGFAWSAKHVDFDNDGNNELLVMNGRYRGREVTREQPGNSYWYRRMQKTLTPRFLRDFRDSSFFDFKLTKRYQPSKTDYSGLERPCLFSMVNGRAVDVAVGSGIDDWVAIRSMAILDYNNDGLRDVLAAEFGGKIRIYKNVTTSQNNWIGFQLMDDLRNGILGTKVTLKLESGKTRVYEHYPTNGHRGQNDPRIHFGIGKDEVDELVVHWPNSSAEKYSNIIGNSYNQIRRGHGKSL